MSYNPVRAANFRKTGRRRQPQNPHAGVKHSDIMRRQAGSTLPLEQRKSTDTGYEVPVFTGKQFVVRHEYLGAGNAHGMGVNTKRDRVVHVLQGLLYVIVDFKKDDEGKEHDRRILKVQVGHQFALPAGLKYSLAASGTADVAFLVIEDPEYADSWQELEDGSVREVALPASGMDTSDTQASARRTDQTKAKAQAEQAARRRVRRQPRAPGSAAATAAAATASASKRSSDNANSANVIGVNPRAVIPTED